MVEGGLPGQTGAISHFRPYPRISGEGKGLSKVRVKLMLYGVTTDLRCSSAYTLGLLRGFCSSQHLNIFPTFAEYGTNKKQKRLLRSKTTNLHILNVGRVTVAGVGWFPFPGGVHVVCAL